MSYVVLARKWRPQSFVDLVGQGHVSRTLANAIATDRVAHAFLFTGVRGVGKTTSARILAKALNCEKGPTAEPCLQCHACREIGEGVDVDVQEIDGASYTGVDAVRSLQETIPYRPARDRFKIYIVDEVHMLSTAAWNAFLKTLEEPPPHVKFIFATTEVNKVPVTILSRCQRYDFKLITTEDITTRLKWVLEKESVKADDAAVHILAREAAGSMRDAMSLLDQVIAWGGSDESLTADAVARVLGVAARSVLHRLGSALVKHDPSACLEIVAELAEQGYPLNNVARDFLEHLRDLVVAKVSKAPERLLEMGDEERSDLLALAAESDADDLSRLYLGFSRAYDDIARSAQPRGAFEMALVRLARRPPLVPLESLLERLSELEQRLEGGSGPPRGSSGGGGGGGGQDRAPRQAAPPPAQPAPAKLEPAARPQARRQDVWQPPPAPKLPKTLEPEPSPQRGLSATGPDMGEPSFGPGSSRPMSASPIEEAPAEATSSSSEAKPQEPRQLEAWEAILVIVRDDKPALASVYEHAAPLEVTEARVHLAYREGTFLAEQAAASEARAILAAAASRHFGQDVEIEVQLGARHGEVQSVAAKNAAALAARVEAARERVRQHPLVAAAVEHLGAELREVRLPNDFA